MALTARANNGRSTSAVFPPALGGASSIGAGPSPASTTGDGQQGGNAPTATPAWNTWQQWLRLWGYGFAAYTVFVILTSADNARYAVEHGLAIDWGNIIGYRMLEEYTCAVFVPPLFWLVHRYPVDRQTWGRNAPILFVGTLVFVVVKYDILYLPLVRVAFPRDPHTLLALVTQNLVSVLLDFWGVIGVAHAVEFYGRAQERERVAAQLRAQLSEAQLQALRSQLHPHFLFNTLNGVATLMHRDVNGADKMVTDLAELLRATLQHPGTHEISLGEEVALLERYLGIVGVRFGDRLSIVYDLEPGIRDALVPQFLLQPLAENAIEHGIARRPGQGHLVIRAVQASDRLCITVSDDGPGLRDGGPVGHGVGLANTRARLRELYGSAQDLQLEAASAAGGVRVRVTLPYRPRTPEGQGRPAAKAS